MRVLWGSAVVSVPLFIETPLCDELDRLTGGERLATWNRHRGHLGMDGKRHPGGEWDDIRALPLRVRRSLTSAGFMSLHGMQPDDFADMLVRNGIQGDPIPTFIALARKALRERRWAAGVDRRNRLARRVGAGSYYEYRTRWVQAHGYASVWHYRKERQWT